jgi:HAD superfamily hydrolase (TIGR01509 family)
VKLHPAVTFVGIIGGAMTFGVLGILLAAPVIASTRVLIQYVSRKLADREPFEVDTTTQPLLHIPGVIAGRKVEVIVFELDGTVAALERDAVEWFTERTAFLEQVLPAAERRLVIRRALTAIEGPIHFFLNQLWHWRWYETIARVQPTLDWLRGYPPAAELELLPGVRDALNRYSIGYRLALVSSRSRAEVMGFLRRSHLDDGTFSAVLAREDVHNILPHVDPLLKVTQLFGVQPNQVLVVSDSDVGLRSARAAEMATAGVTTGLALPENVRDADLVVGDAAVLAAYL